MATPGRVRRGWGWDVGMRGTEGGVRWRPCRIMDGSQGKLCVCVCVHMCSGLRLSAICCIHIYLH